MIYISPVTPPDKIKEDKNKKPDLLKKEENKETDFKTYFDKALEEQREEYDPQR